jgi:hypothetical protein
MSYHQFHDESGEPYGSFETFHWSLAEAEQEDPHQWDALGLPDDTEPADRVGWYWWSCFPGCLPDGDPVGPFETEEEAVQDALGGY